MTARRGVWGWFFISAIFVLLSAGVPSAQTPVGPSVQAEVSKPAQLSPGKVSPSSASDPAFSISLGGKQTGWVSASLQVLMLMTVLSLAPSLLIMVTSFTRIIVVFAFLRQGLGTLQSPPNQVLIGLALFLTFMIMSPVWLEVNAKAIQPLSEKKITQEQAIERGLSPIREFMLKQVREKDLALFVDIARIDPPESPKSVPTYVLIPAFMISELRIAFQIGFLVYLPFLIIDIVVASILMSMGMIMLPPVMISLPFKLILFVLADGWNLMVGSLVRSFVP